MKTTILSWIGIWVLVLSSAVSADADYFMGTEVGSSARGIRIGGVEGFSNNSDSIFENPAALFRIQSTSLSMFSTTIMGEIPYYNAAIGMATSYGNFALGFNTVGVADIPKARLMAAGTQWEYLEQIGSFSLTKSVYKLGYSIAQSERVHLGVAATYYSTVVDDKSGAGFNFDAGLLYDADGFGVSLLLRNVATGLKVKYNEGQTENLPLETVVSTRLAFGDFDVMGQMRIIGSSKKLAKSAALNYTPSFIPLIRVSGGYKEFPVLDEIRGKVAVGLGIDAFGNQFDYAYEHSDHPEYSGIHYFSLALNF
ncbi:hypothetical protein EBR57_02130 [bacterium]|nr:hypothetical protein [bacterium]